MEVFLPHIAPECQIPKAATGYIIVPHVRLGDEPKLDEAGQVVDAMTLKQEVGRWTTKCGIKIRALRGGLITFEFSDPKHFIPGSKQLNTDMGYETIQNAHRLRTILLNAHQACLWSAVFKIDQTNIEKATITPNTTYLSYDVEDTDYRGGSGFNPNLKYILAFNGDISSIRETHAWATISKAALEHAFDSFQKILDSEVEDLPLIVQLYYHSIKACEDQSFPQSLVNAWAVVERLMNYEWDRHVVSEKVRLGDNRDNLKDFRTYTAAVISDTLESKGIIGIDLYRSTGKARKRRNDWMHGLKTISEQDDRDAIAAANKWLIQVTGIDLEMHPLLQVCG